MQRKHAWLNIHKQARAYLPHITLLTSVLDFHVVMHAYIAAHIKDSDHRTYALQKEL
jgi:hypothetical protein